MFRIDFFVDDKYLAEVLRGVAGKAKQLQVSPVVNAVEEKDTRGRPNGKFKQDAEHTLGLFCKEMKKLTGDNPVTAQAAKQALTKLGLSPSSYSHFLTQAANGGLLKKHRKDGKVTWEWV